MGVVKFKAGTAAAFALLESKDNDTLYIITDEKKIYKGDICLSSSYKTVAELPGTGELNTIYVNTTDGSVSYWNGTGYQTIVKATATALSGTGDDLTFPTTKAVIDYITSKMADLDVGALEGRVSTIEGQITTQITTTFWQISPTLALWLARVRSQKAISILLWQVKSTARRTRPRLSKATASPTPTRSPLLILLLRRQ